VSQQDGEGLADAEDVQRTEHRPWSTRKHLVLLLAVAFVMLIIWDANDRGTTVTSQPARSDAQVTSTTSTSHVKAAAAGMGRTVHNGGFEFVVTAVEHPGRTIWGKVGETLTAHGEFVIVLVNVTNPVTRNRPRTVRVRSSRATRARVSRPRPRSCAPRRR
jgi:hypothetical protein